MISSAFFVHALSPLHAGTGDAGDVIDLPTARTKATGTPFVPGSSIKGVLRDARRAAGNDERVEAVFGPSRNPEAHAGALVVGDARLLALPVRSFRGTFAWVSSPLLLFLARRDLGRTQELALPAFPGRGAAAPSGSACVHREYVYLEDLDLPLLSGSANVADAWAKLLSPLVSPGEDIFSRRFIIVDDDTMSFLCETALQIDARVRIDNETRTVAQGALWLEESLPAETLLIGLMAADRSRKADVEMQPSEVLKFALPTEEIIQLGGKASIGRGRCRLIPVGKSE